MNRYQHHPAYLEGIHAALNGLTQDHNPHINTPDTEARQAWQHGFALTRAALTAEYERGIRAITQHDNPHKEQ